MNKAEDLKYNTVTIVDDTVLQMKCVNRAELHTCTHAHTTE